LVVFRVVGRAGRRAALALASVAVVGLALAAPDALAVGAGGTKASLPNPHELTLDWHAQCPIPKGSNPSFHYWYVDIVLTHADGATQGSGPIEAASGSTQLSGVNSFALAIDPQGASRDTIHWVVTAHCNGMDLVIGKGSVDLTPQGASSPGDDGGGSGGSGSGGGGSSGTGGGGGSAVVCTVPRVLGDTLAAAKAAIIAAHCKLGKVTRQPAAAAKLGLVLSQKPRAGTSRPAGTKVKLVLGS
jgi:uncharacterized membrane protein YgcG